MSQRTERKTLELTASAPARPHGCGWRLAVGVGLALLLTGCETVQDYSFTCRLWDSGDLRKFSEPAPDPHLAVFEATNGTDLLVQYDAISEKHSAVERRAFLLYSNESRVAAGQAPDWVALSNTNGMRPVSVVTDRDPAPAESQVYVVQSAEGRSLTVHRPERENTVDLPVYLETSGTATRIALTPLAVAGDTVMVGSVVGIVGFCLWVQSGAPTH